MTAAEFKAWFRGYREALGGLPNEEQWKRICQQIDLISVSDGTYRDFGKPVWAPIPPATCADKNVERARLIANNQTAVG